MDEQLRLKRVLDFLFPLLDSNGSDYFATDNARQVLRSHLQRTSGVHQTASEILAGTQQYVRRESLEP